MKEKRCLNEIFLAVPAQTMDLQTTSQLLCAQQQVSMLRNASIAARARITALQQAQVAQAVKTQLQKVQLQSHQLLQAQQQAHQNQILNGLMRQNAVYPGSGMLLFRIKT